MNRLVALVEGPTEQKFVHGQLAAHLANHGIAMWAILPGKAHPRGGVRKWESARNDIMRTLKQGFYCTTMFDFYAMPLDWPGRESAPRVPWNRRGAHVESAMLKEIRQRMGESWNPAQFIPYVQVHEFEALVFADPGVLAETAAPVSGSSKESLERKFSEIVAEAGHPEAINDDYETCPSRRITRIVAGYRKPVHGPIATQRIGLERLMERCRHFGSWITKLTALGQVP